MISSRYLLFLIVSTSVSGCAGSVRTGLDNVDSYRSLFENKRVGIITNHTAYTRQGKGIIEVFRQIPGVTVAALFAPEHGFEGILEAGEKFDTVTDSPEQVPIYSLYGEHRKPTSEMLENVDVLVFDIQDIGARYYTYVYTMSGAMEAAAENGVQFVVLDRPNPINGVTVQGNILDRGFSSFVGMYPIPVRHGMTVGELAMLFNGQGWLKSSVKAELTVVRMTDYKRRQWYDETGLKFIKPSPNMTSMDAAAVYPGMCLLEGTNISEGRGTESPFLVFGAPWIDSALLTGRLNALEIAGIRFEAVKFTPTFSKHSETLCHGSRIIITNRDVIDAFGAGIEIVNTVYQMYPDSFEWREGHFDRLCGTDRIRHAISQGSSLEAVRKTFHKEIEEFMKLRKKYLLY